MSNVNLMSLILKLSAPAFILNATCVFGATYYVATTGNDGNSCTTAQTTNTPKKTFSSAWGCLSAGDTLVVADGTYTSTSPPTGKAGTSGGVITIRAANDGGAILSGGLTLKNNSYLIFDGFKIISTRASLTAVSAGAGLVTHHVTFRRCGFNTTTTAEDGGIDISDGTHHMLFEDFWAWGGGRYTVALYGGSGGNPPNTTADYNTFRRGVIRQGPASSSSGNPEASLALYYASNNIIENVIALDGNQDSDSSNAAFYLTSHASPPNTNSNKFYGIIALKNNGVGLYVDLDNGSSSNNTEIRDSVIWDSGESGISLYNATKNCSGTIIDHSTIGVTKTWEGIWNGNGCLNTIITSNIITRAKTYGIKNVGSISTVDYNNLYSNPSGNYTGLSAGTHDKTADPQLKYITRIEEGTICKGGGQNGTDCGANVIKQYQDGALTATELWPWPYEARIKKDMCTDAGVTTGFCAKASLTEYVWTYLDHENPYTGTGTGTGTVSIPTNLQIIESGT